MGRRKAVCFSSILLQNPAPSGTRCRKFCYRLVYIQKSARSFSQYEMIPGIFSRSSLRGWGLHHCHSLQQLVQQPRPLISLRSFSLSSRPTSVLVKAQAIAAAERERPTSPRFNQLGLGEELLAFLAEHNLHTPTEIQVGSP